MGAKRLGLKCNIFVSQNVSKIELTQLELGANVHLVKGNYENSLKECKKQSIKNNWKIVQDVSTKNYKYIPQLTMAGYSLMIKETSVQTNKYITHISSSRCRGNGSRRSSWVADILKNTKDHYY